MTMLSRRVRRLGVGLFVLTALGVALGYGIAQSTVVTQAEWAVYLAQGLGLDWNLPPNAKSNHYLARLEWTKSVEFQASQMLEGSTVRAMGNGTIDAGQTGQAGETTAGPAEALYQISMLRAGDYAFRVKLSGGGATLKVENRTFDLYQPETQSRWVDLDRVPLGPGSHTLSLMLTGGARAESLGVTPPCLLPVEPTGGWNPLQPLRFKEMAVTLAKALDLEQNLPELGEPVTLRGEHFTKTLVYPLEAEVASTEDDPYWLSSGGSIVTAVARFNVPEKGVYSIDARYISARPVRWNMDSCLRVVTCPVIPSQVGRRRGLALELEAGPHEIEVTLAPGSKLDRVDVQRRDGSDKAYREVVEDKGFKIGEAAENVLRRDALSAARRLHDRFQKLTSARCDDSLIAMEDLARALSLQASRSSEAEPGLAGNAPGASAGASQISFSDPVFPPVDGNDPKVGSPVQPVQ
jgi:hypothetical protein